MNRPDRTRPDQTSAAVRREDAKNAYPHGGQTCRVGIEETT
jgi:hypothetical protein